MAYDKSMKAADPAPVPAPAPAPVPAAPTRPANVPDPAPPPAAPQGPVSIVPTATFSIPFQGQMVHFFKDVVFHGVEHELMAALADVKSLFKKL